MNYIFLLGSLLTFILAINLFAQNFWTVGNPLPKKISNNAVASLTIDDTCFVFSFMGIDTTKIWSGITQEAFKLNTFTNQWTQIASVPGSVGRIAASAVEFKGKIYIFGGYSVGSNGSETTFPTVEIYDPLTDSYSMGANIPVSVDDQVVAVWNDSLIYSISGWSTNTNVKNVQVYNPTVDTWSQATQIVGPGLFGHSGSIAGNLIVYTGGVKIQGFSFLIDNRTWLGQINPNNPLDITWTEIPNTPKATYRAASGTFGSTILFSGGTDNPYNFDGIGYNGIPSAPDTLTFGYNLAWDYWEFFEGSPFATMDHRGFANCWSFYYTIGGMNENQEVIDEVKYFNILADLPSVRENESIPLDFKLSQNFPNPFNPSTIINYELKITNYEFGKLTIFNVLGEKVKEFELAEPRGSVVWNGTNSFGEQVSSGIYFYKLETVNFSETKKMLLLK